MLPSIPLSRHVAAFAAGFSLTVSVALSLDDARASGAVRPAPDMAARVAMAAVRPAVAPSEAPALRAPGPRALPASAPAPLMDEAMPIAASFEPMPEMPVPDWTAPEVAEAPGCGLVLSATPAPLGTVDLAIEAPCGADVAVVRHAGLAFAVALAGGRATVRVPVLATPAGFAVEAGGEAGQAVTDVPDAATLDRVALAWAGAAGPGLHAREFGAGYGEPGHVWADAPGDIAAAEAGTGGVLVRLGDPALPEPLMAEVYTYPTGGSRRAGAVDLTVEMQVGPGTCGREVAAEAVQVTPGAAPVTTPLTLAAPGCDAAGGWVVVDDLLDDLAVAAK